MYRIAVILGLCSLALTGTAQAQSNERVRMRRITAAENTSLDDLILPMPPYCVKWALGIIAKEVPINFPGLPRIEAFEQTTMVFDPGPENQPLEVTAVFTWPAGSIDPMTGTLAPPIRLTGLQHYTDYGNSVWLFNIESLIMPLRQGTLLFSLELQPRAQPQFEIRPDVFRDGTAWCHFDNRIGPEYIAVSPRVDGTYALAVRGGVPAADSPALMPIVPASLPAVPAALTATPSPTVPAPSTPPAANAPPPCSHCGHRN